MFYYVILVIGCVIDVEENWFVVGFCFFKSFGVLFVLVYWIVGVLEKVGVGGFDEVIGFFRFGVVFMVLVLFGLDVGEKCVLLGRSYMFIG